MKVVVILVIVGIFVGVLFYSNAENQRKIRIEVNALAEQVAYAEGQRTQIVDALDGIEKLSPEAWAIMTTASNLVPDIVGSENVPRVFDKDYERKQQAAAKAATKPVAVKSAAGVKAQEPKTGVVVDEQGREAPAGFTARDVETKRVELEAVKKAPASGGSSSAESAGDKPVGRIAKCQEHIGRIYEHCVLVDAQVDEAATILEESEKILANVKKAISSIDASRQQEGFKEMVSMAKNLKSSIQAEIAAAQAVVPALEAMRAAVLEEKRLVAEAAEKARLAAERESKRTLEISMAGAWYEGKADLLKTYQFKDAETAVKGLQESLTFDEAIVLVEMPLARFRMMGDAMQFLKDSMKKTRMSWGWKTASGALDIETANDEGIVVQKKVIPWTEIPKDRLVGFFAHYLKSCEDVGKKKAELYIGAALFCKTYGLADSVDKFLDQARIESELAARNIDAVMNFTPDASLAGE